MSDKDLGHTKGTLAAFAAYGCWGIFPLFWRMLSGVDALQILAHRIVWASLFFIALLVAKGRGRQILAIFGDRRKLLVVLSASIVMTVNWGIYIWVVNAGRVIESALGYYINPLISVAMGAVFFREKVDTWTKLAVSIASAAIIAAGIIYGSVPYLSLALALTFAAYGAIKKRLGLDPILGLALETLAMAPLALGFLALRHSGGQGEWWVSGAGITILLCLSGLVTAIPLIFFAMAANSISLQRMGFIQYVSPTGQLLIGILVFGERPNPAILTAFAGVLAAVVIYATTRKRAAIIRKNS